MIFLTYLCGMALALTLNVTHLRAFALRLFYATVIVSAHLYLLPAHGREFYEYCGELQFLILIAALGIRCEAALPIAAMAGVAVVVNALAYQNYPSHLGIWPYYYALINTVQVFQILCLITVSPVTIPWIRKALTKNKGAKNWMLLLLEV